MRVQLDRFEDNGMAVLLLYPDGKQSFDVLRKLLPEDSRAADVFAVSFVRDRQETSRIAAENKSLLDELLGRDE
jgi:Protein of unknown function (DUF3006)